MPMFNRYKFARRVGRLRQKAIAQSHVDFSWKHGRVNPFFKKKQMLSRRTKFLLATGVLTACGAVITVVLHPFFAISEAQISIHGLERINEKELKGTVLGIMSHRTAWLLPRNHYPLVDKQEIEDILKERYPIASIVIKKTFPKQLTINIEETLSTVIYDTGGRHAYVGADGRVVELLRPSEDDVWFIGVTTTAGSTTLERTYIPNTTRIHKAWGNYPVVYDHSGKEIELNEQVLSVSMVRSILDFHELMRQTNISILYDVLENGLGHAIVKTEEGWEIKLIFNEKIDEQVGKLLKILKDAVPPNHSGLHYIDIRYGDRVFWQ